MLAGWSCRSLPATTLSTAGRKPCRPIARRCSVASEAMVGAAVLPLSRTRRAGYWRLTGALLFQVLGVSIALVGLIEGVGWWFALVVSASIVLVTGAGL